MEIFKQSNVTFFFNKGRLGWRQVTRRYKLTAPCRTALNHTPALDYKLERALRNPWLRSIIAYVGISLPGTGGQEWTYIDQCYSKTPSLLHAHGRSWHCYMKLKTSGHQFVSIIKFGFVFGIIFFLYYYYLTKEGRWGVFSRRACPVWRCWSTCITRALAVVIQFTFSAFNNHAKF